MPPVVVRAPVLPLAIDARQVLPRRRLNARGLRQAREELVVTLAGVAPGSTIYTDGLKGFEGLQTAEVRHVARTQPFRSALRRGVPSVVPLADRAIGNLQQWLIGTYHGVSKAQLQVDLDEFVFRHNRRRQPLAAFQTLLGLGTARAPTPYRRIRGAQDLAAG